MTFNVKQIFFGLLCLVGIAGEAAAQCAACTATLPSNIPADTIYLDSFPNATKGQYYEEVANFRFPYTTTGLGNTAPPGTPQNLALNSFTITAVNGLPLGLSWTGDRTVPMLYNEAAPDTRDGCIRVCGTPQQSGTFTVDVSIVINVSVLGDVPQNIPITFVVEPDTSAGFTMDTSMGCAPLTVNFTNTIQTLGNETWAYSWDFGDGTTSTDAMPAAVTYADSGTYHVNMTAISTLALPKTYLSSVTVTGVSCSDPFGGVVDLFLTIGSSGSGTDTVTAYALNTAPPVIFNFGTDIDLLPNMSYSIFVQDDDAISNGFPGPESCGTVYFNSDTLATSGNAVFTLTNGGLTARVRLTRDTVYQYDTVYTEDIVVVMDCDTTINVTRYDLADDIALKVYPNPTEGEVNLSFELAQAAAADVQVTVFDALGRAVKTEILAAGQAQYLNQINLGEYGAGIYVVQVRVGQQQWHKRVLVR